MKELGRKSRRGITEINVVPYIDVMLVLLIIFMVTAPMVNPTVIDLPSVSQANQSQTQQPIEVTVRANGPLLLKDLQTGSREEVELHDLAKRVEALQGTNATTEPNNLRAVVIAAEKNIQYQNVMDAMDTLQRAGIAKVGLLVKPKGGQGA